MKAPIRYVSISQQTNHLKGCFKKRRFKDKQQAQKCGRHFEQRAYLCILCQGWHLTSQVDAIALGNSQI